MVSGAAAVFGAHVVATGSDGVVRGSAFTDSDGSFTLPLLPPDNYLLFVEPINPEHTTGEFATTTTTPPGGTSGPPFWAGRARAVRVTAGDTVLLDPISVHTRRPLR